MDLKQQIFKTYYIKTSIQKKLKTMQAVNIENKAIQTPEKNA